MTQGCRSLQEVLNGPVELNYNSPQAAGLVAWWPTLASRGMNKLRDMSGQGLDGTFNGGLTWAADAGMGAALTFDGSTGYVSVPDATVSPLATPYLTFAAWISIASFAGFGAIANRRTATNLHGWSLQCDNTAGKLAFWVDVGGGNKSNSSAGWSLNTVCHVAITYGGANMCTYRNGVLAATPSAWSGAIVARTSPRFEIGRNIGGITNLFSGSIGAGQVNSVALPPSVIYQMAAPQTRWDLYRPIQRFWAGYTASALLKLHEQYAFTGDCL